MWVILPVKKLTTAKNRLADRLNEQQRIELSRLMCADVLATLEACELISGISMISSDQTIMPLAAHEKTQGMITEADKGYGEDVMAAIGRLDAGPCGEVLIIPADVPQLSQADLHQLHAAHRGGITLCPASEDGGTNALLYTAPLPVPLLFGPDSFNSYCKAAAEGNITLVITTPPGLVRDIDRYADLCWLSQQATDRRSVAYSRVLVQ